MNKLKEFIWDENFPFIRLIGCGTKKFLHGQTTSNILKLCNEQLIHTCWLTTTGKVRNLLEIVLTDEGADLIVLAGNAEELFNGLDSFIFPADQVLIKPIDKKRRLQKINLMESWKSTKVCWINSNENFPKEFEGINIAKTEQLNKWKTFQGLPIGCEEIYGKYNPFELGFSDLIDLDKGCYLGQEAISRMIRGASVNCQLRYWESKILIPFGTKLINNSHQVSLNDDIRVIGKVVYSINSDDNKSFGFAIIKSNFINQDHVFSSDSFANIDIKLPLGFSPMMC
tara:strand:- start:262 stop:1113 length:852 start_codon:yes stop_codon:yes gene_type:complete